jgi:phage terminase large subunit-like protein
MYYLLNQLLLWSFSLLMTNSIQYAEDVVSGKVVSGELFRLVAEQHLKDLDASKRGDIPYVFSQPHADHAINFIQKMKHVEGKLANKPFLLADHQVFKTSLVYGWLGRHEDTGDVVRRYTRVYDEIARKGGKSTYLGAVGNYSLIGEREEGAQVYSAATKLSQAKVVHRASRRMMNKFLAEPENMVLKPKIEVLKDSITFFPTDSFYWPLPSTAETLDGLNPYVSLIDEVHEHQDDELIKVIETGMGSRIQPLLWMITTAGFNIYGPAYQIRSNVVKVLKGITIDNRSLCFIHTIDEGDDWKDKSVWIKSNPTIGITPYWSYMNDQFTKAINDGGRAEIQFKTKNLNIWTTSGDTWLKDEDWVATSPKPYDQKMLKGRACWVGMDLSSNKDLTCLVAVFPPTESDPKYRVLCQFYCPEDTIPERSKSDKVNYDIWASDKFIKPIPGKVIDYKYVFETLKEWKQLYNIKKLEYDPTFAYQLVDEIERMGIKCETYGQNTRDMDPPIKEIERLVIRKELDHGCHPVLRWNVANVMLYTDSNGKVKFDKRKVVDKIDGCVALAMAMGGYLSEPKSRRSKYNDEPLFPGMT